MQCPSNFRAASSFAVGDRIRTTFERAYFAFAGEFDATIESMPRCPGNRRSDMATNPVLVENGERGSKDEPVMQGNAHKPAKHIEETARLASSVEPNKDPENVRIDSERSEQP